MSIYLICCINFSLAFSQRATGPSSVCEGSDVILQCVIVTSANDTHVQSSVWTRASDGTPANLLVDHEKIINSTTGAFSDLEITNVTLEDDNTVYTCSDTELNATITSSVVLNVTGITCTHVNIAM